MGNLWPGMFFGLRVVLNWNNWQASHETKEPPGIKVMSSGVGDSPAGILGWPAMISPVCKSHNNNNGESIEGNPRMA